MATSVGLRLCREKGEILLPSPSKWLGRLPVLKGTKLLAIWGIVLHLFLMFVLVGFLIRCSHQKVSFQSDALLYPREVSDVRMPGDRLATEVLKNGENLFGRRNDNGPGGDVINSNGVQGMEARPENPERLTAEQEAERRHHPGHRHHHHHHHHHHHCHPNHTDHHNHTHHRNHSHCHHNHTHHHHHHHHNYSFFMTDAFNGFGGFLPNNNTLENAPILEEYLENRDEDVNWEYAEAEAGGLGLNRPRPHHHHHHHHHHHCHHHDHSQLSFSEEWEKPVEKDVEPDTEVEVEEEELYGIPPCPPQSRGMESEEEEEEEEDEDEDAEDPSDERMNAMGSGLDLEGRRRRHHHHHHHGRRHRHHCRHHHHHHWPRMNQPELMRGEAEPSYEQYPGAARRFCHRFLCMHPLNGWTISFVFLPLIFSCILLLGVKKGCYFCLLPYMGLQAVDLFLIQFLLFKLIPRLHRLHEWISMHQQRMPLPMYEHLMSIDGIILGMLMVGVLVMLFLGKLAILSVVVSCYNHLVVSYAQLQEQRRLQQQQAEGKTNLGMRMEEEPEVVQELLQKTPLEMGGQEVPHYTEQPNYAAYVAHPYYMSTTAAAYMNPGTLHLQQQQQQADVAPLPLVFAPAGGEGDEKLIMA